MSFIADLRSSIEQEAGGYLATHGFAEHSFRDGNGMGASVEYRSPELGLTFVFDRSHMSVDVFSIHDTSNRSDVPRLIALLSVGPRMGIDRKRHRQILQKAYTFEQEVAFVRDYHKELIRMFSPEMSGSTKQSIDALGELRAELNWGTIDQPKRLGPWVRFTGWLHRRYVRRGYKWF